MLLVVALPLGFVLVRWRLGARRRHSAAATVAVQVDSVGVRREMADGRTEAVDWHEVCEVEVYRTDTGPHGTAGGFLLLGKDAATGCLLPIDHLDPAVVEALSMLPGFRLQALTEVLDSPPPRQAVVWRRES